MCRRTKSIGGWQNYSGADRLKQANNALAHAASTLDAQYKDLADCFRTIQCRAGDEFECMCAAIKTIRSRIAAINQAAQNILGVNFNASGGPPLLGGGSMDIDFNMIAVPNVDYLGKEVCKSS